MSITPATQVEKLKRVTTVVADTGDFNAIKKFAPQDATTNPSLIYKAATMEEYAHIIDEAVAYGEGDLSVTMDKLAVAFGTEITKIVPGYGEWFSFFNSSVYLFGDFYTINLQSYCTHYSFLLVPYLPYAPPFQQSPRKLTHDSRSIPKALSKRHEISSKCTRRLVSVKTVS